MFRNYLKISWRNLVGQKGYSFINITGLAIGMAVALTIGLWVWDELSFNKNFKNYPHIAKLMQTATNGEQYSTHGAMPIPLAAELKSGYSGDFERISLASGNGQHVLVYGDKQLAKSGSYVEPSFAEMFSLQMVEGTHKALNAQGAILLSHSLAQALFGKAEANGKIITLDNKATLIVGGVYEDFPVNSNFKEFGFLLPWSRIIVDEPGLKNAGWNDNGYEIYAQLKEGRDAAGVSARIKETLSGHQRTDKPEVFLMPMSRWHLYSEFKDGKNAGGAIRFVWMFGLIGFFVLILACINFMNLSTARSEKRAKEVGIRKAIGSLKKQLVIQFLSESLLTAFISMCIALLIVQMAIPWFNSVAEKQIVVPFANPLFWMMLIGFTVFTGILAGSYPAFYLSSFSSIKVLKGSFKVGRFAAIPRKALVVLQFTVSVTLIIGTIVVFKQIRLAKDRPVGYNREGLVSVRVNTPELKEHYDAIRNDLLATGKVSEMGQSSAPATESWYVGDGFEWTGMTPGLEAGFTLMGVSHDFANAAQWQFKEGRNFSRVFSTDSAGIIINESAAKLMGLEKPIGQQVKYKYSSRPYLTIIGVIKDPVLGSPFEPTGPMIALLSYKRAEIFTIRIDKASSAASALEAIENVIRKYSPAAPFEYSFVDDMYASKFAAEMRIGSLSSVFAGFAVFISCLGLFGLASFTAEQRKKELGVRKVLGASVFSLWRLMSKEFLALVFISFFIAIPLSNYVMQSWLENYTYKTSISIYVFAITCGLALVIALAAVSFQAIKAALMNPVKSLRTE
jgi:putative ABC transport system permease protein